MAQQYWVPHEEGVWLVGKPLSGTGGGAGSYSTEKGQVNVTQEKLDPIGDEWDLQGVKDVCILKDVNPAALLHTLRVRYARDEIYTNISCILVAVNPFKACNIYSSEFMELYHSTQDMASLDPHIFGTGAYAFHRLCDQRAPQAVLISGESGAGKTENTKFVLLYLSEILRSESGLEDKLLEVNPILEAFGNAKTVRNDNSSRFGKWIEVLVNPGMMCLAGASVTDYLLEVTRVCSQGPGERNYHIFYQLTTKEAQSHFPSLQLTDAKDFKYINANPAQVASIDDKKEFGALQEALTAMKVEPEEEDSIFKITAGILHLGNIEFKDEGDKLVIKDDNKVSLVAQIWGCSKEALEKCLRYKRITTGREVMESPLDADKAKLARDSISKMIYSRMFKWLVARCNHTLGASLGDTKSDCDIFYGVLDIAGFEIFETNLLEQLFINLSNEKLQQFFNFSVFKTELAEYQAEGIPIMKIEYKDNKEVLELIEGKGGLLVMLDDATTGVKQTDLQYVTKVIKDHDNNANFAKPKFIKDKPLCFTIKHYAGDVEYTALGFLDKNVSQQPPEVTELMASSSLPVLKAIAEDPGDAGAPKKATVGSKFRKSLASLIEKLNNAEAHFVRCIKPNKVKTPNTFDARLVNEQLKISGVMETVKIRKAGYLMRPKAIEFLQRYLIVVDRKVRDELLKAAGSKKQSHPSPETNTIQASTSLIAALPACIGCEIKDLDIAVGKTKVFIKADLYRTLENARRDAFLKPTLWVQCHWRGFRTRVIMKEVIECNRALIKCRAKAGHIDRNDVAPLKDNVDRATMMGDEVAIMEALLHKAKSLPIKLPSLPLYFKAHAALVAQSKLARQLQDCQTSADVPLMQALLARAKSYKMQGQVVELLRTRCDALQGQLRLRRVLQDSVFYDVLADSQRVTNQAREAGLDKPDTWVLPEGPAAWTGAEARLKELEKEEAEKAKAIEALKGRMNELMTSIDLPTMQATLIQSMTYNMKGELVDKFTERVESLKQQMPCRKELKECLACPDSAKVQEVVAKMKEAGLDTPSKWILPDGPKLYANAACWLSELEQGSKSVARLAADKAKQAEDLKKSSKMPELKSMMKDEDLDILKTDREAYVSNLSKTLPTPIMQKMLGPELAGLLKERCDTVQSQLSQRRKLQVACVSSQLGDVQKALSEAGSGGFDKPEAWVLTEGPKLYKAAKERSAMLEEEKNEKEKIEADIKKQMEDMKSSLDTAGMIKLIAKATAYNLKDPVVDAAKKRVQGLQLQNPIRLGLQDFDNLDAMREAVASAKSAGLNKADPWYVSDGHAIFGKAEAHLKKVDDAHAHIKTAMEKMNMTDMHAAVLEADSLGLPFHTFSEAFEFYKSAKSDIVFVETQVAKLREEGGSEEKISNLLDIIEDPDRFDNCKFSGELANMGVMEAVNIRKDGYLMRPRCEEFVKRYANILPKADKASFLKSQGADAKSANALIEKLPKFLIFGELKAADIAVGKKKVFIKSVLYETLERGFRYAVDPAITKIQARWKGRKVRKIMADVKIVGKDLKKSMAEAGAGKSPGVTAIKDSIHCAALLETSLTSMDTLLKRALSLPIKMAALPLYVKGRASMAAQLHLAQQMEAIKGKVDIPALEVLVEQAKGCGMKGKLVDETSTHLATLKSQVRLRTLLKSTAACGLSRSSDVKKIITEAKGVGLDSAEKWLLSDGHETWVAASSKMEELEAEQKLAKANEAEIVGKAKDSMESVDMPAMQALVYSARDLEIGGDAMAKLKERTDVLEKQLPLSEDLFGCIANTSIEAVSASVAKAKEEGLHQPPKWFIKEGPRIYARAASWLAQLEDDKRSADSCTVDLESQLQDLAFSYDTATMDAIVSCAEAGNVSSENVTAMKQRSSTLQEQLKLCQALRKEGIAAKDVQDAIGKIKTAGLADTPDKWLTPQGPDLVSKGMKLQDGKLTIEEFRAEVMQELQEVAEYSKADLEWHMGNLKAVLSIGSLQYLVGKELVEKLTTRCDGLQRQLPSRQNLQMCAVYEKLDDVRKVFSEVQGAGLTSEGAWYAPDGLKLFTMATSRLQNLEAEAKAAEGMVGEIENQLQELKGSMDLPAMFGVLARAEHCKVKKELVDAVKERSDKLQEQLPKRKELQEVAVMEDLDDIKKILASMKEKGLDSGDKWLLPDGPKLYERACSRAEALKECDEVKKRILKAAAIFDAKELQASFSIANELGMSQALYPEAHELFLNLQDGDFVTAEQEKLTKGEHNDDEQVKVINLDMQLGELGLKCDHTEMQHMAKELAPRKGKKSTVYGGSSLKDKLGQMVYADLANYSDLRDPMSWGQVGLAEKEGAEEANSENMLKHSHEGISEPLTKMEYAQEKERRDLEKNAVKNFKDLLRCMGDKPGAFTGDKAEPILKNMKKEGPLRDEVYVQIMKQLTDNPSSKSLQAGWELFQRMIREGLPNSELCEFVRGFLENASAEPAEEAPATTSRTSGSRKTVNRLEVTEARIKERSASRIEFITTTLPVMIKSTLEIFKDAK